MPRLLRRKVFVSFCRAYEIRQVTFHCLHPYLTSRMRHVPRTRFSNPLNFPSFLKSTNSSPFLIHACPHAAVNDGPPCSHLFLFFSDIFEEAEGRDKALCPLVLHTQSLRRMSKITFAQAPPPCKFSVSPLFPFPFADSAFFRFFSPRTPRTKYRHSFFPSKCLFSLPFHRWPDSLF